MKTLHSLFIDATGKHRTWVNEQVLLALGHGPDFKLKADTDTDTVHGAVTVEQCNVVSLGVDTLEFFDRHRELASALNVGPWFNEQGIKQVKIIGNKAIGATTIVLKVTDTDEMPNANHKTTFKRPAVMPTDQEVQDKINKHFSALGVLL